MLTIRNEVLKAEYLDKHLHYRINSMLAHDLIMLRKTQANFKEISERCYGDSTVVEPIFEISLIFGRSLLNFLGLSCYKNKISRFSPGVDDVTFKSLFPDRDYCPLDEPIIIENHEGLCKIIKIANKSVAHLTTVTSETKPDEYDILPATKQAIYRLMLKYLPEINKENIQWYKQVDT